LQKVSNKERKKNKKKTKKETDAGEEWTLVLML
jgi:hypothetical protein